MLLYSSQHDDIPNVVNVAGRFDMCTGIKERFGENIIERLASEKQIAVTNEKDDGSKIEWTLTKWSLQDRMDLNMATASVFSCSTVLCACVGHCQSPRAGHRSLPALVSSPRSRSHIYADNKHILAKYFGQI